MPKKLGRQAGVFWHSDGASLDVPPQATALYIRQAPKAGGQTSFIDMVQAYQALPEHLKSYLDGKTGCFTKNVSYVGMQNVGKAEAIHPLVWQHRHINRCALYTNNKFLSHICDVEKTESERVLAKLAESSLKDESTFTHTWQDNDLIIWDNDQVIHKATPTPGGEIKEGLRIILESQAA
ncbi:TauD/TfdA dioxygenase family protein [Piscirickettsia litoralis]|uniref:TauD/TfdA-like domain-containing protein n=1 Tax=Piscirickettsia litoralis TaxID=1891921 RepID=A0ABX3A5A6_9GAMM|nr:TauD/TfdA family dioxygenase [Piscirickettsia litoralis]ODN43608.1 hypothetical protein BGC07_12680 [Piscirickettsia litoralis]